MGKKKPIVAVVVAIAVLLAAIFLVPVQPASPAITIRHVKSLQSENWLTETFEITNHTTSFYLLEPSVSVLARNEVQNGIVWKEYFQSGSLQANPSLFPHSFQSFTVQTTNLPVGSPLRLKLFAGKRLDGLNGLLTRLRFRFQRGMKVSLNPFTKTDGALGKQIEILSDEFVEPEPK